MAAKADPSDREIVLTRVFNAPRELVFEAWTDPAHLPHWWGPRGFRITSHAADIRPGGTWRFTMHGPDGKDYLNIVDYREIVKPTRIVYAHRGDENDPIHFVTTATFDDAGGKTRVTMRAVFPSAEARDFVVKNFHAVEGGNQTLDRLGEQLVNLGAEGKPFTIAREFAAPLDLVFKAWTERERLVQWWGPKGAKVTHCENDLRAGGTMHFCLRTPDGADIWGKWVYRDVLPPERIVFVSSFSDPAGGVTRHPMAPVWPPETLSTISFAERNGRTTVAVRWVPINASAAERKAFDDNHASMHGGWGGTFDQLGAYLKGL